MTQTKAELLQTRHQGDIRLGDADSSHYVGFKAPATVSSSLVWTLPAADGTANYLLKTDGSGNLAWTADNSGVSLSGSTNNTIATVTGANALQGEANLTFDGTNLKVNSSDGGSYHTIRLNTTTNNAIKDVLHVHSSVNSATAAAGYGVRLNFSGEQSNGNEYTFGGIAGLYVDGGANNGQLAFYTNNSGTNAERMRIDSSGRVGIGVTPNDFHANNTAVLQLKDGNTIFSRTGGQFLGVFQNLKYNSSDVVQYIANGLGTAYFLADGVHKFFSASSGTANNNATLSEKFRIGASGQFGIGGTNYGTSGQVLTSGGGSAAPTWADAAGGGATPTVKTANYTAASGDLVVVNGSGLTITLPSSPSVADSVEVRILGSRYCTIARNGSNIESTASNFYIDTFDGHTKFIYTDSTRGWLVA